MLLEQGPDVVKEEGAKPEPIEPAKDDLIDGMRAQHYSAETH